MDLGIKNKIQGVEKITEIFGRFPSFHDAEVLKIVLDRSGSGKFKPTLEALVWAWQMTSEVDENRRIVLENHCLVNLKFSEIANLSLQDFNHQNVINELVIEEVSDKHYDLFKSDNEYAKQWVEQILKSHSFYVKFEYCHGVVADFLCKEITVLSVKPLSEEDIEEIRLSSKRKTIT